MTKKAIILLSGGLDSATTLALAKDEGYELTAISFNYSQRHKIELEKAKILTKNYQLKTHKIIDINPEIFQNSALTSNIKVPEAKPDSKEIPITYVPARNILFLTFALSLAESLEITEIFIGANAIDYSGYPDCRPEFIEAFEKMANIGTKLGHTQKISIKAPLLNLTKKEIIAKGLKLNLDYSQTISCYNPSEDGKSCGVCDSCYLRLKAFKENNINDPIEYV